MDFEADVLSVVPEDKELKTLKSMVDRLIKIDQEIMNLNDILDRLKTQRFEMATGTIPSKFAELELRSLRLDTGEIIEIKDILRANIPERFRDEAFQWLRDHDHGDLIKNEIKAVFGRGEDVVAVGLYQYCTDHGYQCEQRENVPWNTLTAFVKEMRETNIHVPSDLFGVFEGQEVKIRREKS